MNQEDENIYQLYDFLKDNPDFNALKTNKDFTSVQITFIYDIKSLEYLIKQFSQIFYRKFVLNGRRSHYLMIEHSLGKLENLLDNIIKLRNIEQKAGLCAAISKMHNFNVEDVLQEGTKNKLVIFMTKPQRDRVIELMQKIGARSEGVIVLVCVIWALNAAFSGRDFSYDKNEDEMDMSREYWQSAEGGVYFKINKYIQDLENKLRKYVCDLYVYLNKEFENSQKGKKLTMDKKRLDCVERLLREIKEYGFYKYP